jgi:hypothetical protein
LKNEGTQGRGWVERDSCQFGVADAFAAGTATSHRLIVRSLTLAIIKAADAR